MGFEFLILTIFEFQRRSKLRFRIPSEWHMTSSVESVKNQIHAEYPVFDISIGGCALILPKNTGTLILENEKSCALNFYVEGKKVSVQGEARYVSSIESYDEPNLCRVGFRFLNLSKADETLIENFIIQQIINQY